MLPTRPLLGRSVWKGPNIVPYVNPILNARANLPILASDDGETLFASPAHLPPPLNTPPIRTQKRAATILPNFVGLRFAVHNGKKYQDVLITEEMVGRKLGEYVATRKRFTYKQSKNK
ncbi:hypothetical protein N7492_006075 [Penicillium capsulatum]|uniref:Ribosomal protein S19 n=1 Tax=Penicillium capsulatum TaxID=69766 RepID=A0A9W9I0S7_9EURO|nr:hypothetical protein N7492_006075 [Penicillium capsulatum]